MKLTQLATLVTFCAAALPSLGATPGPATAQTTNATSATAPVSTPTQAALPTTAPATIVLRPFFGTYLVKYRGISAGTTEVELTSQGNGRWEYQSRANARGMFRAFFSDEITQTSWLDTGSGSIRPLKYRADDGSKDTERDITLDFDWNTGRATGVAEEKSVALSVEPGTQDAMSLQLAVIEDLRHGRKPGAYLMVDKDRVKEYRYVYEGEATVKTVLGELPTIVYRAERSGSKRATRTWYAPSLTFLPVRAERLREGKREWLMEVQSLKQ